MTGGRDRTLASAMRAGDIAALDRIGRDRPGLATDAEAFLDVVATCPAATVRRFLANGADPDPPVDDGFPALHLAIDRQGADRAGVAARLLDHGAAVNARGANDWTVLHRAASVLPPPLDLNALLLDRGADRPCARTSTAAPRPRRRPACSAGRSWRASSAIIPDRGDDGAAAPRRRLRAAPVSVRRLT